MHRTRWIPLAALALALAVAPLRAQEVRVMAVGGGPQALLGAFFGAMFAGDLTLLRHGGALSGTVEFDEVTLTLESGERRALARDEVAMLAFDPGGDQVTLREGGTLTGALSLEALRVLSPEGRAVDLPAAAVGLVLLAQGGPIEVEVEEEGDGNTVRRAVFVGMGHGLRSQNLFAEFAKALTAYDLAVYPDQRLWSGTVQNERFTFHSNSFGTLEVAAADLSGIELGDEPGRDFISLKVGDRVSGTLAADSAVRFQPVGMLDDSGSPITLTLARGQVRQVGFKQPASAFGSGGRGPALGGGPGK